MKKYVVALMAVGLLTTAANGAMLNLSFPGGLTEWTLATSESVEVEVWFQMNTGDSLAGVGFRNDSAPGLDQIGATPVQTAWTNSSTPGILGTPQQFVGFGGTPYNGPDTGVLLGSVTIHQIQGTGPIDYDITIDLDNPVSVQNAAGGGYTLVAPGAYTGYAGYYGIGTGSPGYVDGFGGVAPANPLILHHIPEPGSLALLALGGIAMLRRRR